MIELHLMSQSKKHSILEQVCNVLTGVVISFAITEYILYPYYNIDVSPSMNFTITAILTVVSIARGYLWRRYFNSKVHTDKVRR